MSLWQRCECRICNTQWCYNVRYKPPTMSDTLCNECEIRMSNGKRASYFANQIQEDSIRMVSEIKELGKVLENSISYNKVYSILHAEVDKIKTLEQYSQVEPAYLQGMIDVLKSVTIKLDEHKNNK